MQAHAEQIVHRALPVRLVDAVDQFGAEIVFERLVVDGRRLVDVDRAQLAPLHRPQKEGDAHPGQLVSQHLVRSHEQAPQVRSPQQRLVESSGKAHAVEPFDEGPLSADEIVAQDIDLPGLPFPFSVELLDEQTQSLLSLALTHITPRSKDPSRRGKTPTFHSAWRPSCFSGMRGDPRFVGAAP